MYEVIVYFEDLQDKGHPYDVGDIFPRQGLSVSHDRLVELSTNANRRRKPLIKRVEEKVNQEVKEKTYTKTEINRMSTAELQGIAKEKRIEGAENHTGAELKKILIEKFGL